MKEEEVGLLDIFKMNKEQREAKKLEYDYWKTAEHNNLWIFLSFFIILIMLLVQFKTYRSIIIVIILLVILEIIYIAINSYYVTKQKEVLEELGCKIIKKPKWSFIKPLIKVLLLIGIGIVIGKFII